MLSLRYVRSSGNVSCLAALRDIRSPASMSCVPQTWPRFLMSIPAGHFKFLRVWSVKFLHPARQDMMIVSLTLFPGQGLQRPL